MLQHTLQLEMSTPCMISVSEYICDTSVSYYPKCAQDTTIWGGQVFDWTLGGHHLGHVTGNFMRENRLGPVPVPGPITMTIIIVNLNMHMSKSISIRLKRGRDGW